MKRIYVGLLSILFTLLLLTLPSQTRAQLFSPVNLGSKVNSECPEVNPVLSKGGDTLFFSRIDCPGNRHGEKNSQDIWMSVKDSNGEWGEAVRLPDEVNIGKYNALYAALDDGKTFLIGGVYDKNGKKWLRNGFSFISTEGDSAWSAPKRIKVPGYANAAEGDFVNAHMTSDGQYLFLAYSKCWLGKNLKLYVSTRKKEGTYSRPKKLKGPMKGFKSAETPVYSPSDGRLYFSGRGKNATTNGMYYVTPADGDTTMQKWDSLVQLSDTVHIANWNSYFTPDKKGEYALLCNNASDSGSNNRSDIYRAMLVETRPWVHVVGRLIDERTGGLLAPGKDVAILVNGQESDSVSIDNGNQFTAILPLDAKYEFTSKVPNFISDSASIDVTGRRLYLCDTVDLTLKTLPYVLVSGTTFDSYSLTPINRKYKPQVLVDGKVVDSLKFDHAKSSYQVNLPFGKKYTFSVKAIEYESVPMEVDLTNFTEYGKLKADLFAKPLNPNMVTLYGKIINTKTGKPLTPGVPVQMRVNRQISQTFQYNDKNASYRLMLPAGADYDLVPKVYNFYNKLEVVNLSNAKPRSKVPRDFFVTPLEVGQSVDIENIYFETGKSKLKPESYRSLNALVDFFNEYPNVKVEIGGHTDNTGSLALNKRLSKERAQAVADYMIGQGIGKDRFQAVGHGPDKPKATNKTKEGRAKNRRVDFTIIKTFA